MRIILVFTAPLSGWPSPAAPPPGCRTRSAPENAGEMAFNTRASQATIDAFSAIAEQLNCRRVALQHELDLQLKGA
jgi:hypothetical protein